MEGKKFYYCKHCGNILGAVVDGCITPVCCAKRMELLQPNTTDAAGEKHVPVVTTEGNTVTVTVGSVEHPMTNEHYITWIFLETEKGGQRRALKPGEPPVAKFILTEDDAAVGAYAYCNLHGLWYGA